MIAQFKKTQRWSVCTLLLLIGLGVFTLTDAQNKSDTTQTLDVSRDKARAASTLSEIASDKTPAWVNSGDISDSKSGLKYKVVSKFTGPNDIITVFDKVVLSPNGKFLNWQGQVIPVDGSRPFSLTDLRVWGESWSPDGKLIACCGVDGLYIIPVNAETGHAIAAPKRLLGERVNLWGNQRLQWTRDSEQIVFTAWDQAYARLITKVVSARDGKASEAPDWAKLAISSPDGQNVAYSPRGNGIWVRSASGGSAQNVSGSGPYESCEPIAWSKDGHWIIGHVGPGRSGDEVRMIHFPEVREFKLPVPASVGNYVGIAPARDQVFFYRPSFDLAFLPKVMSIKGGSSVVLTARQPELSIMGGSGTSVTSGWGNGMPRMYYWISDGMRLLVSTVNLSSGKYDYWLYSFTGEDPIQLKLELPKLEQQDDGLLAPDGSKLLVTANEAGTSSASFIVPISLQEGRSSGLPIKLCNGYVEGASWSPNGTILAVIRDHEIWTYSCPDSNWTQLTRTTVPKSYTAWSPDGSMLAYYTAEPDKAELWAVPAEGWYGQEPLPLTTQLEKPVVGLVADSKSITLLDRDTIVQKSIHGDTARPLFKLKDLGFTGLFWLAWSPDGRKLAFCAVNSLTEQDTLFLWEPGQGRPLKLSVPALTEAHYSFAWAPDSQHIAYTSMERPKTRLHGILSRLDVADALKLAANKASVPSPSTNQVARTVTSTTNTVPLTNATFTDHFDNGASASWKFWYNPKKELKREHSVKNGELVLENSSAILGEPDWTNYVVRARVYLESSLATGEGIAGFNVRQTPDNPNNPGSTSSYSFFIVCYAGKPTSVILEIGYHDQSGQLQHGRFDLRRPALSLNQWYTLELEVKNHQLRGYLDKQLVAEAVDDRLTRGGLRLNSWNTRVHFDDFSVTLLP